MSRGGWIVVVLVLLVAGLGGLAFQLDLGPFAEEEGVDALRNDGTLPAVPGDRAVVTGVAPADARVMILGDSVTQQSAEFLDPEFADLGPVSVIGLQGYRTDELLPTARDVFGGDDPPEVAVVMAGYNDVWQHTEVEGAVEEMIDLMGESPCAIWVLIPTAGPWEPERATGYNERVVAAAEAAGVHVETAWRDVVDDEPGDAPNRDLVGADLVHPAPAGRAEVARVMAASVAANCPAS